MKRLIPPSIGIQGGGQHGGEGGGLGCAKITIDNRTHVVVKKIFLFIICLKIMFLIDFT